MTPSLMLAARCLALVGSIFNGADTHLLHAHFSAHSACTITFAHLHACAHTRMAQVHEKGGCRTSVFVLYLAFSLLMFHPSLLFLPAYVDFPFQSTILPYFPVLEAHYTRNAARGARSLAIWPSPPSRHNEFCHYTIPKNLNLAIGLEPNCTW